MLYQAHGVDLMDIAAGGHLDQTTTSWLGDRAMNLRSGLSSVASSFFDQAQSLYQMISTNDAVQAMRNLVAKADTTWMSNNIHGVSTIEQLQTANPIMQRYIMANPVVRDMYLNNMVEGYSDSYTNLHGNAIGDSHYDYRRVMDGVMIVKDDHTLVKEYIEFIPEGEKELTLFEKVDILNAWNLINTSLDANELDPTSPVGNRLG